MPSETIYDQQAGPIDLRISWNRDMVVQVGAVHREGAAAIVRIVNEWLVAAKHPTIDFDKLVADMREHADGGEPYYDGYHATLERTAANELIRVVRRARDQAFGRDE